MELKRCASAMVLALAVALTSCGFPAENSAEPVAPAELPAALRASDTVVAPDPGSTAYATLWFVQGNRLVAIRHQVGAPVDVQTVVAGLLVGPSRADENNRIRSALPDATVVGDSHLTRGTVTVELSASFADIPVADQLLAVGQLVLTLTDLPGVGSVQFTDGESPIAVPVLTGESSSQALSRDEYLGLREGVTDS
jgi:spore germination protein GerM